MARALLSLALVLVVGSCQGPISPAVSSKSDGFRMATTPVDGVVEGRPTWGAPMLLPGTSSRIVPYARESRVGWFGDYDRFAEGGKGTYGLSEGSYSGADVTTASGSLRWHNGVVVDLEGGAQWNLLGERGILSRYWMRVATDNAGSRSTGLVFAATVEDSNGDGVLDDRDAMRALYTDGAGSSPRYVTPAGTQLRSVSFDPEKQTAVLMVAHDDDGDGTFEDAEAPAPYLLRLTGDQPAEPMVRPAMQGTTDGLLAAARR